MESYLNDEFNGEFLAPSFQKGAPCSALSTKIILPDDTPSQMRLPKSPDDKLIHLHKIGDNNNY